MDEDKSCFCRTFRLITRLVQLVGPVVPFRTLKVCVYSFLPSGSVCEPSSSVMMRFVYREQSPPKTRDVVQAHSPALQQKHG